MATSPSEEVKAPQHFKTPRSHALLELLDGDRLGVFFISTFEDDAVGALAHNAQYFILVHRRASTAGGGPRR